METLLTRLAESVSGAENLESLTRPLLELLEAVTGMESTYLTTVDETLGVQHVLFARNSQTMQIPEGLSVPWNDTLCKRALEEGRAYTDDVAACWGDSEAAQALGIKTYLSQPVRNLDGGLYGTLCAASGNQVSISTSTVQVLGMFARLISHQVERERLVESLRKANQELSNHALIDPLTGIANRRALMQELGRLLAQAQRENETIQIAFIDLNGFKAINDLHGHEEGDRFLVHVAAQLTANTRRGDLVARYGGDEFVVIAKGGGDGLRQNLEQTLAQSGYTSSKLSLDSVGASIGVVTSRPDETDAERLLARADAAMYEIKRLHRAARRDH